MRLHFKTAGVFLDITGVSRFDRPWTTGYLERASILKPNGPRFQKAANPTTQVQFLRRVVPQYRYPAVTFLVVTLLHPMDGASQAHDRQWIQHPALIYELEDKSGDYFGNPSDILGLPGGGFVIIDDLVTLRAFDPAWRPLWTTGRSGSGPGEYRAIRDIALTANGDLLVLDPDAARITVLNATTGEFIKSVPLNQETAHGADQILSVAPPHLAIVQGRPTPGDEKKQNWRVVDTTGTTIKTYGFPPACEDLACSAFSGGIPEAGSGVLAFRWSSDLVFFRSDGTVRITRDGVEPIRMAGVVKYEIDAADLGLPPGASNAVVTKVDPTATEVTTGLASGTHRAFTLIRGSTENRGRVVDIYRLENGDYEGSFLLPSPAYGIAVLGGEFLAVLSVDLFPRITIWDLRHL